MPASSDLSDPVFAGNVATAHSSMSSGFAATAVPGSAIQPASLTSTAAGALTDYADAFLFNVSSNAGTITARSTAVATSAAGPDHGMLDLALDLTAITPDALATVTTTIVEALERAGLGLGAPTGSTTTGNTITYTLGVQDAGHTHADLIATLTAANTISLHADYHLVL